MSESTERHWEEITPKARTASALSILDRSEDFSRLKLARLQNQAKICSILNVCKMIAITNSKTAINSRQFLSRFLVCIDKDLEQWRIFLLALVIGKRSRAAGANY
jgi:hypothetical protein